MHQNPPPLHCAPGDRQPILCPQVQSSKENGWQSSKEYDHLIGELDNQLSWS